MPEKPARLPTGIEFKPGFHVIAVPTIWKLESGGDTAHEVCSHVAYQMFGEGCRIWEPDDLVESAKVYAQALVALEGQCQLDGRTFEVVDPLDMVVRIGGPSWVEAGLRWMRIVKVSGA